MELLPLFCDVDDFCQAFEPKWRRRLLRDGRRRDRRGRLALSEIMTILIAFHQSGCRTFKSYYHLLERHHRREFPGLVGYGRFVELMPSAVVPLCVYLVSRRGRCTGLAFVDSTALAVCGNKRISRHRVFDGWAAMGRTTMGWFLGFKLHLVINEQGELLGIRLTPGNIDDRTPVPELTRRLWGKLFGDKGYISQALFMELWESGLQLITNVRKNMRPRLRRLIDKLLLRKRSLIETVNDQLKNISQIEHTRHRSPTNFLANLLAGLISYTHQPKKPTINFTTEERRLLRLENRTQLLLA